MNNALVNIRIKESLCSSEKYSFNTYPEGDLLGQMKNLILGVCGNTCGVALGLLLALYLGVIHSGSQRTR